MLKKMITMNPQLMEEQEAANRDAGTKLKDLRVESGMSQEDLSFAVDLDQSVLSRVERLGPQMVSWGKVFALAGTLNCIVEIKFRKRDGTD